MISFYNENSKIGVPLIVDRGTDIVSLDDYYFFNFNYKTDKLEEFKKETISKTYIETSEKCKWISL